MPELPEDLEFTPTEVTVSEQFQKRWDDPSQVWRLLRIEGRQKVITDEWIGTPDVWRIKKNFGGGRYILQPMDDRGKYVPGSHTFTLPGKKKNPDEPDEEESFEAGSGSGNDYMLKYLIEEKRRLEEKLEYQSKADQRPNKPSKTFDADEMSEFIDALMKKKIAYKAMAPIIEALDTDKPRGNGQDQIRLMLEMLEKGLSLGRDMSGGGSDNSSLIEKMLVALAPKLFESRDQAKHKITDVLQSIPNEQFKQPQAQALDLPQGNQNAKPNDETVEADMLYQRLERAIRVLVDMLDSEREFTDAEICDSLKSILTVQDVKLLGSNFNYEALIQVTQAEPELKLVIMEKEDRVKKVIDLLRSNATGTDAGSNDQG